jgi:hypothetical protein
MAHQARHTKEGQVMQKLRGLFFASVLLCSGGAQAFQLNAHTPPTISRPPPPGGPPKTMDQASPTFFQKSGGTKGVVADKHKDW